MSKIAITVDRPADVAKLVPALRRVTGMGVGEIKARIDEGRPVAEYVLFGNDHDEVARKLRDLSADLPALGARARVYELGEDDAFEEADLATNEIDLEILRNILQSHDREVTRQEDLYDDGEDEA